MYTGFYRRWRLNRLGLLFTSFIVITYLDLIPNLKASKFLFKKFGTNESFLWQGCPFRKAPWLLSINETDCIQCMENGTTLGTNSHKYFMRYINCTEYCSQPVVCTEYKFNFNGTLRSECFACESLTHEMIIYKEVPMSELCGTECVQCASEADLLSAIDCHKSCDGKPTFCPKNAPLFFGQRLCYQSSKLYGCTYKEVDMHALRHKHGIACADCATHVGKKNADFCSYYCGNLPTWHKHVYKRASAEVTVELGDVGNETKPGTPENTESPLEPPTAAVIPQDEIVVMQCTIHSFGEILVYEIPDQIRSLINKIPINILPLFTTKETNATTETGEKENTTVAEDPTAEESTKQDEELNKQDE